MPRVSARRLRRRRIYLITGYVSALLVWLFGLIALRIAMRMPDAMTAEEVAQTDPAPIYQSMLCFAAAAIALIVVLVVTPRTWRTSRPLAVFMVLIALCGAAFSLVAIATW